MCMTISCSQKDKAQKERLYMYTRRLKNNDVELVNILFTFQSKRQQIVYKLFFL